MKDKLDIIAQISDLTTSNMYFEDILKLIVTITAQVMQSNICSLMILDEKKKVLELRATQSVSDLYNRKPPLKLGEGIAGRVAKSGKPIVVKDVKKDDRYVNQKIAEKENLSSLVSLPLIVRGRTIGVLNLYTAEPRDFSEEEIRLLTTIANQAAVVIDNYQLLLESKSVREELEARKKIERAKGLLMKEFGIGEDEAYRQMQKYSMDRQKSMKEIAEAIILTWEMKKDR